MEFSAQDMERMNDNSLYRTLGIVVDRAEDGRADSRLKPVPEVCWPFESQPHGGVLFTLMDTTMAWAVLTLVEPGDDIATINLDIQYTRRARGEVFNCRARVTHRTRQVAYTRAEITDDQDKLVAAGQGAFWMA